MTTILHLTATPLGEDSLTHGLSSAIVAALRDRTPDTRVLYRDLATDAPPHADAEYAAALVRGHVAPAQAGSLARSDALIEELECADAIVIGTPMHNLTVPSALKAWLDHVIRAHRTMRITPQGKFGTLRDRPVYLALVSGGLRTGPQARQPDFLEPYLRAVLPMIGLHDITVFSLEGTARGPEAAEAARLSAHAAVARHFAV